MKGGNEFSKLVLSINAEGWLLKLHQSLILKDYGKGTLKNYMAEMTLLFKYCHEKNVEDIRQDDVERYLLYIKEVHKVGRAKYEQRKNDRKSFQLRTATNWIAAQAFVDVARSVSQFSPKMTFLMSFFTGFIPSNLYPKKQFILPEILSEEEVDKLLAAPLTLKEQCVVGILYGSGIRISELCNLRIKDIESLEKRIKVCQGKGGRDRFTLLPDTIVDKLREFYITEGRPADFLFTSKQTKRAVHVRSMQVIVNSAMEKAGFKGRGFTAHTLRHSFATHMLNQGNNIHVIKTLLGHSKIETTMIYLHLQRHTQLGIVSPLDVLNKLKTDGTKSV